jgi:NADH dehydrogenase
MKRVVTVFGGSGFIGRQLVRRLAATGSEIRVAVRDMEAAMFLKVAGAPGQITLWPTDVTEADQVATAVAGADTVINLIGVLYESGRNTFDAIHTEAAGTIARAAQAAGASRMVHVSALSADADANAAYARTKAAGEDAVRSAFAGATIVRPSVVFGPDDNFFNMFAGYTRLSPVLPVFGCPLIPKLSVRGEDGNISLNVDLYGDGGTRFQPVYVDDVADAIMAILGDGATQSKTYEFGGPQVYSFKQIMDLVLTYTGRRRFLAPMPFGLTKFYAWFLQMLPKPLLTCDQV